MALVNQVEKRVKMSLDQVVQYQILTYCFLSNITLSSADLRCLTMLALDSEHELNSFCNKVHQKGIFKSPQSVRNAIIKAEKNKLIVKEGKSKKRIWINPELKIQTSGNVLLDYKFLGLAPE
jgi:hypothetical protein